MLVHWLFSFIWIILIISQHLFLCGNLRWSENGHFKAILCCHSVNLRCWKQAGKKKKSVPAGVWGYSSTPGCTVNINDTELWGLFACEKRKSRCVEQESGVCCEVSEAGEQQLVTNKKPRPFSVHCLRGRFAGAAWGNKYDLAMCICIYLMCICILFIKNHLPWVEEGTCTARDVVNSLLCCSGVRKVLAASVSRYSEVTAFCRLFPVSEA